MTHWLYTQPFLVELGICLAAGIIGSAIFLLIATRITKK